MTKFSTITEDKIKVLVDSFYGKVVKDEALAPIFNKAIHDWPPHLSKMYDFWSSVMLQTKKYKGNPLVKHQHLMPFDRALFKRWLALFAETSKDLFEEGQARLFIEKSEQIADSLQYMLYEFPGGKESYERK